MAENVALAPLANLSNDGTAIATINANNTLIEDAFVDCLSLVGNQPNALQSNLDMNNFNIVNLPAPSTINSPVRVTDLNTFSGGGTITINPLPAGGAANAILDKNSSTNYDASWTLTPSGLTSIGATTSTVATSNITGTAVLSGSSSGTTTVQASAAASGTLTLPAATDTLVGKATIDVLINKTLDTAGAGNVLKINGTGISAVTGTGSAVLGTSPTIATPNVIGTSTNDNAPAGSVGEYVESDVPFSSAASTSSTGTLQNITSIVLTAGDWDVSGQVTYQSNSATNFFQAAMMSFSTTSATQDFVKNRYNIIPIGLTMSTGLTPLFFSGPTVRAGPSRFSLAAPTTIYLVSQLYWTTSTQPTAFGTIRARRIR